MKTSLCSNRLASLLAAETHECVIFPSFQGDHSFTFVGCNVAAVGFCKDILPLELFYFYETKSRGKRTSPKFSENFTPLSLDDGMWECRVSKWGKSKAVGDYVALVEFRVRPVFLNKISRFLREKEVLSSSNLSEYKTSADVNELEV